MDHDNVSYNASQQILGKQPADRQDHGMVCRDRHERKTRKYNNDNANCLTAAPGIGEKISFPE